MNFLIIDGNSLINRAFYGIKLLTAKDGHYTNAIFGFMNMFLNLMDRTHADAVAVAFDLKAPTFRHKMYDAYKAGRKPMPAELYEQMEPLKEILHCYGCHIVTCEGYEADDIIGTLASHVGEENSCFIATGDRDALQLVRDNVTVLLPSTKMGQTVTEEYTPAVIREKYGVSPLQMIEIKALQGDSSDNIPGVPGVGPKTAMQLIAEYGDIDAVFNDLDHLNVTENLRVKLRAGKESAYLSKKLGTICLSVPIDPDPSSYTLLTRDDEALREALLKHELFKLLSKLQLSKPVENRNHTHVSADKKTVRQISAEELKKTALSDVEIAVLPPETKGLFSVLYFSVKDTLFFISGAQSEIASAFERLTKEKLITSDAKGLCRFALQNDLPVPEIAFDIRLAAYLLNPNASDYSIPALALSYHVPAPELSFSDTQADEETCDKLRTLACFSALKNRLASQLEECDQTSLLCEIELPLAAVLADMEHVGMAVDKKAIAEYAVVLAAQTEELEKKIYEAVGEQFNIQSPKQLGMILFEKLGLPAKKKTKTGYSTNAEVLEGLANDYPIVEMILNYRTYAKLKSTYCDGLLKTVADDGRIHSTFNQTETRTGRLSSTEPNLQNIPVRTAIGREFRKFFVAKEGCVLVDADYSQIELRVLAALADDQTMLACFNNGVDIHTSTASKVFGVPEEHVTPELRSRAKAVNFGIVYGIGAFSLAKDIHVTRAEADSFIKAYLALYSSVDRYMQASIQTAREKGYAETIFHRRRYLPELASSNGMLRAFGERVARNMPIQGTAADIIKIAMIRVYNRLKKELPEVKLIMQVHDELILEAPEALSEKAADLLREEMENAVSLSVKLAADAGIGKTWYEAKG